MIPDGNATTAIPNKVITQVTNIRQRGIGNTNPVKFGRCIAELERIYGIKNGNNQHTGALELNSNPNKKTQDDLADELGMTKRQLSKYKSLTDLIPELQDAVQSGQITATTAMGFVKKLSPEEQRQQKPSIRQCRTFTGVLQFMQYAYATIHLYCL